MLPDTQFWAGKRVLLTGHTGFKGGWMALWLARMGARVTGVALAPNTSPSLFDLARVGEMVDSRICDIRDATAMAAILHQVRPEIVLHLAAQPLVRAGYAQPLETFETNVMGTANVLDAVRGCADTRVVVAVTTDKVYRNLEWTYPYREDDRLGGHDPYSASKAGSELVIASYRDSFLAMQGVHVASARAGNVIGGGDWSADRLIPDAVRAWQAGETLSVRRPDATRPWQHVIEPVAAYLVQAQAMWTRDDLPRSFNFGPDAGAAATVKTVVEIARAAYGSGNASYGEVPDGPHEAGFLALEVSLARAALGITPKWPLTEAVSRAMRWYREQHDGADVRDLCFADLAAFEQQA